ncbi:MAG TPA: glycoside hydrolase, partial [Candidatus Marinimicrobia bacterium]|nr:glycoside hydrolase [Candidatus Neomarinimicrobiota bacterium]
GNYPNPFNATTVIHFSLDASANVSFTLYDLAGREIRSMKQKNCSSGPNTLPLDLSGLSSGLYLYTLSTGQQGQRRIGKMTLVK